MAQRDIESVTNWLESHGFRVNKVYPNRMLIDFSGTAGQIREAFHTAIHQLDVNGELHIANISDPRIPAALAPVVKGIASLQRFQAASDVQVGDGLHFCRLCHRPRVPNRTRHLLRDHAAGQPDHLQLESALHRRLSRDRARRSPGRGYRHLRRRGRLEYIPLDFRFVHRLPSGSLYPSSPRVVAPIPAPTATTAKRPSTWKSLPRSRPARPSN